MIDLIATGGKKVHLSHRKEVSSTEICRHILPLWGPSKSHTATHQRCHKVSHPGKNACARFISQYLFWKSRHNKEYKCRKYSHVIEMALITVPMSSCSPSIVLYKRFTCPIETPAREFRIDNLRTGQHHHISSTLRFLHWIGLFIPYYPSTTLGDTSYLV